MAGVAGLAYSLWEQRRIEALKNTPVTSAGRIACPGYYAVRGTVECDRPLDMPGTADPCVYYHVKVLQREVGRDERGRASERWVTLRDDREETPFRIRDRTGAIRVLSIGAEIDAPRSHYDEKSADMVARFLASVGSVTGMVVDVEALRVGGTVLVVGPVSGLPTGLVFERGNRPFMITYRDKETLLAEKLGWGYAGLIGGPVAFFAGLVLILVSLR